MDKKEENVEEGKIEYPKTGLIILSIIGLLMIFCIIMIIIFS